MTEKHLDFWNERARFGPKAGTNDLPLKNIEMQTLSEYVRDGQKVLDIGCGNGVTVFHLLDRLKIDITGVDFSENMVAEAKRQLAENDKYAGAARFGIGDVRGLTASPEIGDNKYDVIMTERVLINLTSWEDQQQALRDILALLRPGGIYLMCENSADGLRNINEVRTSVGLSKIDMPWHNRYISDSEIRSVDFAELVEYRDFTSTYYFLSRVVNAWIAGLQNREPDYDSDVNKLTPHLLGFRNLETMGLGQTRLMVWRNKA
jgi:ubiquinone/menaquinone biosynthesis C-methylase UbiE